MTQTLEEKIGEIIYVGMFCDPNECDSQYIDATPLLDIDNLTGGRQYLGLSISKPCSCGGEYQRLVKIKAIESLCKEVEREARKTDKVTRVEVVDYTKDVLDENRRAYVNWRNTNRVELSFQDDDRTLKIFISKQEDKQE